MARVHRRLNNATISRLKSFLTFIDPFSSVFKSGWKVIRSGWSTNSTTAIAADPSTYPISTVQMSNVNVTIDLITTSVGTGAALWVTDSGNWFGVVSQQSTIIGGGACASANPYNPCGAYSTYNPCSGYNAYNPCSSYSAYTECCGSYNAYSSCCGNYNSYTCNPFVCYQYSTYNSCPGYTSDYCGATNPYNCNPTYTYCSGVYNSFNYYLCVSLGVASQCGGCRYTTGGGNCSGGNCVRTATCKPPTGGDCISSSGGCGGGNCNGCGGNCNGCGGGCVGSGGNCNSSGGNCLGTGGTCNSYYNTYPRYLKVIRYLSNVLTEVASVTLDSLTSFPALAGIKVIISGGSKGDSQSATITAKAFQDSSLVSQIGGSLVYNPTGVKIVTNYGILASPSNYNQGNTIDQISIS
jgi:hypothetical protein